MEATERSVWILARELSFATLFPALTDTSDGKFHLCHWGVLVTSRELSEADIIQAWNDRMAQTVADESKNSKAVLGVLYELDRVGSRSTVNVISAFGRKNLHSGFSSLAVEFIGTPTLSDQDIENEGMPV